MSSRRSSTLVAVATSLAVLALLVGFVALGSGGGADEESTDGALPSGFERIPEDTFFDRVYGAQRAAGSWHLDQVKEVGGRTGSTLSADTVVSGDGTDTRSELTMCCFEDGSMLELEVIGLQGAFYTAGLPSAKRYWRVDPAAGDSSAALARQIADLVSQETSFDLQDAVESVELIGKDRVVEAETAHYVITLDTGALGGDGTKVPATVDVWVDEGERPVRSRLEIGAGAQEVVSTSTYTLYGEDFTIEAPPASQVTDRTPRAPQVPTGR